jgi:biofilm PGA synthesis N-glycosyltransferase PgaC
MVEGLRAYGVPLIRRHTLRSYAVGVNWGFPYLDAVFTLAWIPGLILAFTGNFAIVGPMTLAVLPVNAAMSAIMFKRQRQSLRAVDLHVRRNVFGFLAYFFFYQLIMSPVSLSGYIAEAFHRKRSW